MMSDTDGSKKAKLKEAKRALRRYYEDAALAESLAHRIKRLNDDRLELARRESPCGQERAADFAAPRIADINAQIFKLESRSRRIGSDGESVEFFLSRLNNREKTVITDIYRDKKSYAAIAGKIFLSESRVCQIHLAALDRLSFLLEREAA